MPTLEITAVSTRAEMLAVRQATLVNDDDEDEPIEAASADPICETGRVVQWTGRVGGLLPDSGMGALVFESETTWTLGARVSFVRSGGSATDVRPATEDEQL
jgi:hypothetical protein